ncbi:MAG: ceramidase domain-containing protein [Flavobacteriales bacterium]|nr:ceramidase domain-containing protein [Flavobacteriales bacterium]
MTIVNRYYRGFVLVAVFIVTAIALNFLDPIAQDLAYHRFSDCRTYIGIPHFMDVVSNIPFLIIGFMGIRLARKAFGKDTMANFLMTFVLFVGVFLTGLGSAFYHYAPNNFTLIFDRLPMTLVFTAFFATIIYDYVDKRVGAWVFYFLLVVGAYSIFYWYYTEIIGKGDLRLYAFIQFFPVVAVPLILVFYKNRELYTKRLLYVFGAYILAKLFEHFDTQIFEFLGFVSGHTIKHLLSALAVYYIYQIYQKRLFS